MRTNIHSWFRHPGGRPVRWLIGSLALVVALGGCGTGQTIDDPLAELQTKQNSPNRQQAAMAILDQSPDDPDYIETLHGLIWRPGFTVKVREAALVRLEQHDPEGLQRTIRQRLPQLSAWEWLERLCQVIADRGWVELSPALVSSWARPVVAVDDLERPEYLALAALHGTERVVDVVFELLVESTEVWQQGFRTRCWTLLHRLGERDRLAALLESATIDPDDGMLLDLQAAAMELDIVPRNREEILWIREIHSPDHREFWEEIRLSLPQLDPGHRADLELRDLSVVVSAARHDPELLQASSDALYGQVEAWVRSQRSYSRGSLYDGTGTRGSQRLYDVRDRVTWGDLAAMLVAIRALQVPEVTDHMLDYAERDRADESTEYGGVIALDRLGRFEVLEYPPRIRHHDQKFIASQEMFDAGYTALFHFHFHVQRLRNDEYAGPGAGDLGYADQTRANCLVLTYVREGRLNVDYYRHGSVVVDLGVIERR